MITPEDLAKNGSEDGHQAALFQWAALNFTTYPQLKWFHAIPNDNQHKRLAQGVRSGVCDTFLPVPIQKKDWQGFNETFKYGYHGLYIEMKKPSRIKEKQGGVSDDQTEFMRYALSVGYFTAVCYSWQQARDVLIEYLEGRL